VIDREGGRRGSMAVRARSLVTTRLRVSGAAMAGVQEGLAGRSQP
jgi:hypothetical protein